MAAGQRPRGGLEQEILVALAALGHPATVAEVLAELPPGLAYTTVMTSLSRLHDKGAVSRAQDGRSYRYGLPGGVQAARDSVTARRMRRLLDAGADRAGVLARFVEDLSAEEEQLLVELLEHSRTRRTGDLP